MKGKLSILLVLAILCFSIISFASTSEDAEGVYFVATGLNGILKEISKTEEEYIYNSTNNDRLSSIAYNPFISGFYYIDANKNLIMALENVFNESAEPEIIYEHNTYVRHVRYVHDEPSNQSENPEDEWHLYFSESDSKGKIYRINDGATETIYKLDLDFFWAGNFSFSPDGTLYISSGNSIPASLYKYNADTDSFDIVYTDYDNCIMGFDFIDEDNILYGNHDNSICSLNLSTQEKEEYFKCTLNEDYGIWMQDILYMK